jgi:hypothetical protein
VVPPCSDRISRVPPYSRIFATLRIRGYHPLWPDFPDRSAYLAKTTGLFRVRSPLLAESLLMSFPPGTEMFQFPGFASLHYVFMQRYPCGWVAPFGYPRINACSRLPVAFRSVPRPSSPPGAKASTECPSYTRYPGLGRSVQASPCTETILRSSQQLRCDLATSALADVAEGQSLEILVLSAHTQFLPNGRRADRSCDHHGIHPGQIVHRASEPSPPNRWGVARSPNAAHSSRRTTIPGQTSRLNNGTSTRPEGRISITRAQRRTRT